MSLNLKRLAERGWLILKRTDTQSVEDFLGPHYAATRRVEISSSPVSDGLIAQEGDFWFHTDGCFLTMPPRLISIQVQECERGGALSVLDCSHVLTRLSETGASLDVPMFFGQSGRGTSANLCMDQTTPPIFRYRRDFMSESDDPRSPETLATVHAAVETASAKAVDIGELQAGETLVVDNWRLMHRRAAFEGIRRIERVWYDPAQ